MVEMWYYTCEGKQMDPVSIADLMRLAGEGRLKPTDMVWKEGMPRWLRAGTVADLFPGPSSPAAPSFAGPTVTPIDDEARSRRGQRRPFEEENADQERKRRRRPVPTSGGYGTQILIACLAGGFILLGSLVVGILIMAAPSKPQRVKIDVPPRVEVEDDAPAAAPLEKIDPVKPPPPEDVKTGTGVLPVTFTLPPGAEHILKFRVKANHAATIKVTPLPVPGKVINLDMQVFTDSDNALIAADETPSPSASVAFTVPATQIVRVRVRNASNKTTVTQFTFVYSVGN